MRFLLDTNVLSEPMRAVPDPSVVRALKQFGHESATAAPVWHELLFGLERLPEGRRKQTIATMLGKLRGAIIILPYDGTAARWHARERARLVAGGWTPAFADGQIAAIAAVHQLVLVTRNVEDFGRFEGLHVQSWFA